MSRLNLPELLDEVRKFDGIRRKRIVGTCLSMMGQRWYDDGAIIGTSSCESSRGGDYILTTDSIMSSLVRVDPYHAGWSAMLVSANDCVAMGSMPTWAVDIISGDETTIREVSRGLADASKHLHISIVGGHTNPEGEPSVSVAMVGVRGLGRPLLSSGAKINDIILLAVDLTGKPSRLYKHGWDAVSMQSPDDIQEKWKCIIGVNDLGLIHAGKDISMPGILGTIVSLCEASGVGAVVNLDTIPTPDGITMAQWLCMFQSMGFIFATNHENLKFSRRILSSRGFTPSACGLFTDDGKVTVRYGSQQDIFWDIGHESLYGYGGHDEGR